VHHVDHTKKWYRSLYFHEERLVGGILIGKGNRAGKRRYLDAIKAKERFPKTAWEAMLAWHAD
jgi:NAD(P)H-nitrite reductase large subunit